MLCTLRRRPQALARAAHRDDLVDLFDHPAEERERHAKAIAKAIDALRTARPPEPQIVDAIAQWRRARYGCCTRSYRPANVL
ncbi:hypothetical protein [Paraburkholderia flagellata]|uniref:hypothetical protein n=1 Tax=Paraburkholderia flagellata TaxID=2883241 RepID=UPI0022792112|nr:hypothetical protein [Paraburkholderia flagellata]